MTAEALAAWVAVAGTMGTCGAVIFRTGRRDGKIDAVLEGVQKTQADQLELIKDHEARLRAGKL